MEKRLRLEESGAETAVALQNHDVVHDTEASLTRSPPGLASPVAFTTELMSRPLPSSLTEDVPRRERLERAIRECVESLYRDRVLPCLRELQGRIRGAAFSSSNAHLADAAAGQSAPLVAFVDGVHFPWTQEELRAILILCACDDKTYIISPPPGNGNAALVLLREPPHRFLGRVDDDFATDSKQDMLLVLQQFLTEAFVDDAGLELETSPSFDDAVTRLARKISVHPKIPASLKYVALGDMRHLLTITMSVDSESGAVPPILHFDPSDGRRLRLHSNVKTASLDLSKNADVNNFVDQFMTKEPPVLALGVGLDAKHSLVEAMNVCKETGFNNFVDQLIASEPHIAPRGPWPDSKHSLLENHAARPILRAPLMSIPESEPPSPTLPGQIVSMPEFGRVRFPHKNRAPALERAAASASAAMAMLMQLSSPSVVSLAGCSPYTNALRNPSMADATFQTYLSSLPLWTMPYHQCQRALPKELGRTYSII